MQVFLRCYDGSTRVVRLAETATVDDLAAVARNLNGPGEWALDHAGRRLDGGRPGALGAALPRDATVSARLLVRAGKGGFGSNLRAAGKQRIVDNFDACRDLDGRRIRARTAEAALRAWEAEAPQRALERVAERYAVEAARREAQEAREAAVQLDTSDFRKEARGAARAVREALAKGMREQPGAAAGPAPKRAKIAALADAWGSDDDEDEDDGSDEEKQGASGTSEEVRSEGEAEPEGEAQASAAEGEGSGGADEAEPAAAPSVEKMPEAEREEIAADARASVAPVAIVPAAAPQPSGAVPPAAAPQPSGAVPPAAAPQPSGAVPPAAAPSQSPTADSSKKPPASAAEELTDAFIRTLLSPSELTAFPPEAVKAALARRGLKAGGTPEQRAERLFLLKDTPLEKLDRKHFAKGKKA